MKKTIDEILGSYQFFLDIEVQIRGIYRGKERITGIPAPVNLQDWFTIRDLHFPQQIYVSCLKMPPELKNNAILDITGRLRRSGNGLFYFDATDVV